MPDSNMRQSNLPKTVVANLMALIAILAIAAGTHRAIAGPAPIYTGIVQGVAVGGYDAVAYFKDGKAQRGDEAITLEHGGAIWRFATKDNRDLFAKDPAKYEPQYGGYCAWAVSQGYTAKGDPNAWKIVDGRLYLNYNKSVQSTWEKNAKANIGKADINWPKILGK